MASRTKQFQCRYCENKYFTKYHRDRHENVVHKKMTFKCSLCMKDYSRNEYLKKHMKTKHPDEQQPTTSKTNVLVENETTSQESYNNDSDILDIENSKLCELLTDELLQNPPSPAAVQRQVDEILCNVGIEYESVPSDIAEHESTRASYNQESASLERQYSILSDLLPEEVLQNPPCSATVQRQVDEILHNVAIEDETANQEAAPIAVDNQIGYGDDGAGVDDDDDTNDASNNDSNNDSGRKPYENADGSIDEGLKAIYEKYSRIIYAPHRRTALSHEYNFHIPTGQLSTDQVRRQLNEIYLAENQVFKIQLSLGLVISNRETGELRFFYPHNNEVVLETPTLISNLEDLDNLLERLSTVDFEEQVRQARPDTKWLPYRLVTTRWLVNPFDFPIGAAIELPAYIKRNGAIISLTHDVHTYLPYEDSLCAFRCLAYHVCKSLKRIASTMRPFVERWQNVTGNKVDDGVDLWEDLPLFEDTFETNINIYSLQEDEQVKCIFRSIQKHDSTMNLNLYKNHLSYIKDMSLYAKKFKCQNCDKLFPNSWRLKRHAIGCSSATTYKYPGGFYKLQPTVFEKLEEYDIVVPESLRYYPFIITYDFEAMLSTCETANPENKLQWLAEHRPIPVSVCSNVPNYEQARCFIHPNLDKLLNEMFKYMREIQRRANQLTTVKFQDILSQLDAAIDQSTNDEPIEQLEKLQTSLREYMSQIPLLGYNSSRYDLSLTKKGFVKHLMHHDDDDEDDNEDDDHTSRPPFVVKKGNAYSCISTEKFKLLDVINYATPGTSYDSFLRAYKAEVRKSFFPYEWLDTVEKLDTSQLPPYEAFYSKLKKHNVLEAEYNTYETLVKNGCSREEALREMALKEIPKTGQQNYEDLLAVWERENMTTFRDFLAYYNNLDVQPFVRAVENMMAFYRSKGIDLFKESISAPGVARKLLMQMKDKDSHFSLFNDDFKNIHSLFSQNIVGGPSIIFKRYHEAGVTKIRDGAETCQSILGYDANALYLWCIGQDMPTGPFTVRRAETDFRKEKQDPYMAEIHYLEYVSETLGIPIQHKLNGGQRRIGPYLVDGISGKRVWEFNGCYFHKHNCHLNDTFRHDTKWQEEAKVKRESDAKRKQYLEEAGYEVTLMYECEFNRMKEDDEELICFLQKYKRPCDKYTTMSESQIKRAVLTDELFGAVEVDINVKQEDYEKFSEMSPLFCTVDVPMDAIGEHMKQYMKERGLSSKPRRLLVGGMRAEKILLATPLLKWYMQHNLEVTKIHTVIEFTPAKCFSQFVEAVSNARRLGDADKAMELFGNTMKLLGNSAYGGMILDKLKHRMVKFFFDQHEARMKVNDRRFRKLDEIEESFYELEMAKRVITLDLPNQVGFFILQFAKLRMLSFYYDFLDRFVDRSNFEMVEMDTDSTYFACSKSTLEEAIRPEMREEYQRVKYQWLPRDDTPEQKAFTKRQPGLHKLEFRGTQIAALCSKTYCVYDDETSQTKFSCKGVNKHNYKDPMDVYRRVLESGNPEQGNITGFRAKDNRMFTYTQDRIGFSYFYCKRRVLADGVSTAPLDITLTPAKRIQ